MIYPPDSATTEPPLFGTTMKNYEEPYVSLMTDHESLEPVAKFAFRPAVTAAGPPCQNMASVLIFAANLANRWEG